MFDKQLSRYSISHIKRKNPKTRYRVTTLQLHTTGLQTSCVMPSSADPPLAQSDDELFDVVDDNDNVTGQQTRRVVHDRNLLHRAVHIWVFNSAGNLLLQMRSPHKDQYPSTWTSSASGHVDAGESYSTAAHRELEEELGLQESLQEVAKLPASPQTAYEFTSLWAVTTDAIPRPNAAEVTRVHWWTLGDLAEAVADRPHEFSPPLVELLNWWLSHIHSRLIDN